jgi:hypothetical protein
MDFSFSGSRNQCKTKTITKQMMVGCPLFKKKEWRNVLLRMHLQFCCAKFLSNPFGIYSQDFKREL